MALPAPDPIASCSTHVSLDQTLSLKFFPFLICTGSNTKQCSSGGVAQRRFDSIQCIITGAKKGNADLLSLITLQKSGEPSEGVWSSPDLPLFARTRPSSSSHCNGARGFHVRPVAMQMGGSFLHLTLVSRHRQPQAHCPWYSSHPHPCVHLHAHRAEAVANRMLTTPIDLSSPGIYRALPRTK